MKTNMLNFKERRILTQENLKKLCIENKFYTRGDNKDYTYLMNFTKENVNLSTDDIIEIACDIKVHSDTELKLISIIEIVANSCYTLIEKF